MLRAFDEYPDPVAAAVQQAKDQGGKALIAGVLLLGLVLLVARSSR